MPECRSVFTGAVTDGGSCWPAHFLGASVQACANGVCVGGSFGTQACVPGHCVSKLGASAPCRDDAGTDLVPGCGEGLLCDRVSDTCTPVGTLGSPCVTTGERCDTESLRLLCLPTGDGGLACDVPRAAGGFCQAPEGYSLATACRSLVCEGGRCQETTDAGDLYCMTSAFPCPTSQYCSWDQSPPRCAPRLGAGVTCSPGADVCVAGLRCATDADAGFLVSTCQAIPSLGQPCDGPCVTGLVCVARADGGSACASFLDAGAGCAGAGDVRCPGGTVCRADSSTCAAPGGLGGACAGDLDCDRGLSCSGETRTCTAWRHAGEACHRDGECLYGFQCADGGVCRTVCTAP